MSIDALRKTLLWCAVINYGILLVWFLFFIFGHDWIYLLHSRWFHPSQSSSLTCFITPECRSTSSVFSS
jgi:Family of unknown function (DUF6868)